MNKDKIREILYIIAAILIGIFAVRFVIWLFPVILIGIVSFYIYNKIKIRKSVKDNKDKYKDKNIKVIHDFDDDD